jgi:hypothetical protein
MLQDLSCSADGDVGGYMPVMSMVDKSSTYILANRTDKTFIVGITKIVFFCLTSKWTEMYFKPKVKTCLD